MPALDPSERRSQDLEEIRVKLQKYLDRCGKMKNRQFWEVTYDLPVFLSPSEEKAMLRHTEAYGFDFIVSMTFTTKSHGMRPSTTAVTLVVRRRQRKRRNYL